MQMLFKLVSFSGQWFVCVGLALTCLAKNAIAQSNIPTSNPKDTPQKNTAIEVNLQNNSTSYQIPKNQNTLPLLTDNSDTLQSVTSVSQLSDVRSNDWAFMSLQSLIERYGCISGDPNRAFRGLKAISRYEFAAGLNACLDKINEILTSGLADKVDKADVATIQKLQEEFATELSTLRGRVDKLELKTTKLESQQFSTTTKLFGQAIFGLQGRFANTSDINPRDGIRTATEADPSINLTFGYNLGLTFLTQFDTLNRSLLLIGLSAGNVSLRSGQQGNVFTLRDSYTSLGYEGTTNNQFVLSDLSYRFKVGNNAALIIGTAGVSPSAVFRGLNRFEGSGNGPISAFAQRNPILGLGGGSAGIGFDWQISDRISLQGVYAAGDPTNATAGGLFGGSYVAGLQATLVPSDSIDVALYYLRSYTTGGSLNTGIGDSVIGGFVTSFLTDAIGATINWRPNPYVNLGAWGGYTTSNAVNEAIVNSGTVETTNWLVYLNFPDLFKQGDLAGIYIGQPPKITSSNLLFDNIPSSIGLPNTLRGAAGAQPDTTTQVELFYRYRLTNNITITPGVIFIFNPLQTASSDTITIGTIRTTFSF